MFWDGNKVIMIIVYFLIYSKYGLNLIFKFCFVR